jgi:hypothetical protein
MCVKYVCVFADASRWEKFPRSRSVRTSLVGVSKSPKKSLSARFSESARFVFRNQKDKKFTCIVEVTIHNSSHYSDYFGLN